MSEQAMAQLRAAAQLGDLPPELVMLLGTLSTDELLRLEWLSLCWPVERGEIPWAAVRRCLDQPGAWR